MKALPPDGQPYLIGQVEFEWTKGAVKKEVDVKVPRRVVIRGKVIEQGTGRALFGASASTYLWGTAPTWPWLRVRTRP